MKATKPGSIKHEQKEKVDISYLMSDIKRIKSDVKALEKCARDLKKINK